MRVLIVEDEKPLLLQLVGRLEEEGYAVSSAADGEEGLYLGMEYAVDMAVIDLGLPNLSGIDLIKKLRAANKDFPILILTARSRWQDKVEGLEAGGDDYLVKPFHVEELLARLKALLRRSAGWSQAEIQCGPVVLNTNTQQVTVDSKLLELTAYEYKILEYLMLHAGEVISKIELTEHIYDQDYDRDSNVIEVFIGRLRRKLDPDEKYNPIETLRGRGYRFALARSTPQSDGS
ncbi:MAG: transcriptional regulator [Gammaproteobacteria bacterium SG8_11]|nr:MAG: transcriptional regulator [Gammaproteobacteria bacterium SG8_11]